MLTLSKEGMVADPKVVIRRYPGIEHGSLDAIRAIVVHQSDAPTAAQTFNAYQSGGNGAHFLVDKNGRIYQTASLRKRCFHVGRMIKSKCLTVDTSRCDSATMAGILALSWVRQIRAIDALERGKNYPDRYPVNSDSIGIELVGASIDARRYEPVTSQQNASLRWLVGESYSLFGLTDDDVFRHPEVSYKHPGEAGFAAWK